MAVHSDYCTCPECVEKYTSKAMTDVTAPVDVEATARFKKDIQTVIDLIEAQAATIKQLEQPSEATVKRVARALCEAGGAANWVHALECARAAIAALATLEGDTR